MEDNQNRWCKFAIELDKLLYFWIFGILYFFFFRIVFIILFRNEIVFHIEFGDYVSVMMMGFKFDATVIGYFMLIPMSMLLLFSLFDYYKPIRIARVLFQYLFVIFTAFICVITLNYYKEYKAQFNNFLFLGLYDDQGAVLQTLIEYYDFYFYVFIVILLIVSGILFFHFSKKWKCLSPWIKNIKSVYARGLIVLIVIGLFVCSMRGSFSRQPAMRKWSYVSKDDFLNKTIINPYRSLKYAYADFKKFNSDNGENPYLEGDLRTMFGRDSVSQIIGREAKGNMIEKPRQIFLVVMESYDCWPLMDKYEKFGVSANLSRIASKGTHFTHILSGSGSTFDSYSTVVMGIPHCGVNLSLIGTLNEPYLSSLFSQFKRLGYKTNLFYGGLISWENIGEFSGYQGCDNVYSSIDMGGKSDWGIWAKEDEEVFATVLDKIDSEEYTFNVILTSSYHAPYEVDIYSKGFPYKTVEDIPAEVRSYFDGAMSLTELGHVWYGDYAIGRFMDTAGSKYKDGLFAFTGDHYARRFINHSPNLYERSAVPFVLYGDGIPSGKNGTPGSHTDISATLLELVAPRGFKYYSFGESLFDKDKESGFGFTKAIDKDSLFYFPKDALVDGINLSDLKENKNRTNKYQSAYDSIMGLAWHYVKKGNLLEKE